MTQLTDKIREAIIGNVGTVVSGRIGVTDAELLVKKFEPVFTIDDLTKMPNFQGIASVMINNTPSAPFSMSFTPPLAKSNDKLADAMKKLSATKYGRPRVEVEAAISKRIATQPKPAMGAAPGAGNRIGAPSGGAKPGGGSFLDEWLAKRQQAGAGRPGVIRQPNQIQPPPSVPVHPAAFQNQPMPMQATAPQPQLQPQPQSVAYPGAGVAQPTAPAYPTQQFAQPMQPAQSNQLLQQTQPMVPPAGPSFQGTQAPPAMNPAAMPPVGTPQQSAVQMAPPSSQSLQPRQGGNDEVSVKIR